MVSIDVDFDVYKELMARRTTQAVAFNDVLRRLLGLPPDAQASHEEHRRKGWISKNVTFPDGTEFEAVYKGKKYSARVADGRLIFNGQPTSSLSLAARGVTSKNINGWRFWRCRFPDDERWRAADSLRAG